MPCLEGELKAISQMYSKSSVVIVLTISLKKNLRKTNFQDILGTILNLFGLMRP